MSPQYASGGHGVIGTAGTPAMALGYLYPFAHHLESLGELSKKMELYRWPTGT